MFLDSKLIRNVMPYYEYYVSKGLNTELLRKCNSQSFKFIGGIGEGYFITDNLRYTSGSTVTLTVPSYLTDGSGNYTLDGDGNYILNPVTATLYVADVIEIEHPDEAKAGKTRILHTFEEKYFLSKYTCQRNYNVVHRRTQRINTAAILPPDATPKSLAFILIDLIPTLIYSGPDIYPYDVFIQGMSVSDAVDYLCAAYGLVWTYQGGNAFVYSVATPTAQSFIKIVDVQEQIIDPPFAAINVVFPVLDCCQQYPNDFDEVSWSAGVAGEVLNAYMPFYPAIYDSGGENTNTSLMTSYATALRTQLQAANKVCRNYIAHEFYKNFSLTTKPATTKITYADLGSGPRTFLSGDDYPYLTKPKVSIPNDRQAKEWIGYLYQDYKGIAIGFWVIPGYGLDGLCPEDNQFVTNLFKWNYGKSGAAIYVKWDCVNYRWIAIQQEYECPPATTPPPPDPPPELPSYGELAGL